MAFDSFHTFCDTIIYKNKSEWQKYRQMSTMFASHSTSSWAMTIPWIITEVGGDGNNVACSVKMDFSDIWSVEWELSLSLKAFCRTIFCCFSGEKKMNLMGTCFICAEVKVVGSNSWRIAWKVVQLLEEQDTFGVFHKIACLSICNMLNADVDPCSSCKACFRLWKNNFSDRRGEVVSNHESGRECAVGEMCEIHRVRRQGMWWFDRWRP